MHPNYTSSPTVEAACRLLLARTLANREPTTYEGYRHTVEAHILPALGPVPLNQITVTQVEAWLSELLQGGLGARSAQLALKRLRQALSLVVARPEWGLSANVARSVEMPRTSPRCIEAPSDADLRALFAAVRGERLEAVIAFTLMTGTRMEEVLGLQWKHVDLPRRVVRIQQRLNRTAGKLQVRDGVKMNSAGSDQVPLADELVPILEAHRARARAFRVSQGGLWRGPSDPASGEGFVFSNTLGTPLEPRNFRRWYRAMCLKAGLEDRTFHQLRHDCASLLLHNQVPLWQVSRILRHADPSITNKYYAHLAPDLQREAVARMGPVIAALGAAA